MAKYRTAIIACGTIGRVHTRGWLGVQGQPISGADRGRAVQEVMMAIFESAR